VAVGGRAPRGQATGSSTIGVEDSPSIEALARTHPQEANESVVHNLRSDGVVHADELVEGPVLIADSRAEDVVDTAALHRLVIPLPESCGSASMCAPSSGFSGGFRSCWSYLREMTSLLSPLRVRPCGPPDRTGSEARGLWERFPTRIVALLISNARSTRIAYLHSWRFVLSRT
jgi:hypothetical protein